MRLQRNTTEQNKQIKCNNKEEEGQQQQKTKQHKQNLKGRYWENVL